MTTHSKVTLPFADGEYTFDVGPLKERLELEEKCNCGLLGLVRRLNDDSRINDYREPIRLGLIGGGEKPAIALRLVQRYVDSRPAMESVPLARSIVMAALVGVEGDDVGKSQADQIKEEAAPSTEKMAASSDPQSTVSEQPSVSVPEKLTASRSGNSRRASTATTQRTGAQTS